MLKSSLGAPWVLRPWSNPSVLILVSTVINSKDGHPVQEGMEHRPARGCSSCGRTTAWELLITLLPWLRTLQSPPTRVSVPSNCCQKYTQYWGGAWGRGSKERRPHCFHERAHQKHACVWYRLHTALQIGKRISSAVVSQADLGLLIMSCPEREGGRLGCSIQMAYTRPWVLSLELQDKNVSKSGFGQMW